MAGDRLMARKAPIQAGSYGQEQELIPFFLGREGIKQKLIRRCVALAVSRRKGWGARSQLGTAGGLTLASLFSAWQVQKLNPLIQSRQSHIRLLTLHLRVGVPPQGRGSRAGGNDGVSPISDKR